MPYLCDIRSGSANNVIEVGGKLFIEGVEFTPTNLAPIAFSQGPTAWAAAAGATATFGVQAVGQLCLPRTYVAGNMGVYPALGNAGQFDSTKIACGQDLASTSFIYSATQARYYGAAGYNATGYLTIFDNNFRVLSYGASAINASAVFSNTNQAMGGFCFLPLQNSRWIVVQAASAFAASTTGLGGNNGFTWGILTEAGTYTSAGGDDRYPAMPYIGTDWVVLVGTPQYPVAGAVDANNSVTVQAMARNTGTATTLNSAWLPASTNLLIEGANGYYNYQLCYPSNVIVETPGSSVYFYMPTMSATGMNVYVGTVSSLGSTPTINAASTAYTITSPGGVDTTTDIVTYTGGDPATFSRVRFATTGTLPSPLAASTDYWTIRQTATSSRLATSYANAVAGIYIDLTTTGTGTQTMTSFSVLNIDTSQVVYPSGTPGSSIFRNVRAWTFTDSGTNYLCMSVYEPGSTTSVATGALNLYLWRLDSKFSSTFLQKVALGTSGRVRATMPIDSTQKRIVVVYDDKIVYYGWNSSTNWTFQSTQNLNVQDVGIDSTGRVWATDVGSYDPGLPLGTTSQSLYVYEPAGAATNITVSFAQSAYTYAGVAISSNLVLNAYDTLGNRVAISVTLTRNTSNFSFTGGASSTTVTTSAVGNTSVPISVFSTGQLSVLAVPT